MKTFYGLKVKGYIDSLFTKGGTVNENDKYIQIENNQVLLTDSNLVQFNERYCLYFTEDYLYLIESKKEETEIRRFKIRLDDEFTFKFTKTLFKTRSIEEYKEYLNQDFWKITNRSCFDSITFKNYGKLI